MELSLPSARQLHRPAEYAKSLSERILKDSATTQRCSTACCKVTLFEVCCARSSKLGQAALRQGHALVRIYKPRRWRMKRRRVDTRGVWQRKTAEHLPPYRRGHPGVYAVDVCKAAHRARLLALLCNARPAPGTSACHLHVSFPCSAFCAINTLQDPKGMRPGYRAAVARLTYERRLLRSFCQASVDAHHAGDKGGSFRVSRSHEKSGGSRLRPSGTWPWGMRNEPRARVASCMCGLRIGWPLRPSAHIWCIQSDHDPLMRLLLPMKCCGGHEHARSVMDSKRYRTANGHHAVYGRITETENYTLVLGHLMMRGISLRR